MIWDLLHLRLRLESTCNGINTLPVIHRVGPLVNTQRRSSGDDQTKTLVLVDLYVSRWYTEWLMPRGIPSVRAGLNLIMTEGRRIQCKAAYRGPIRYDDATRASLSESPHM